MCSARIHCELAGCLEEQMPPTFVNGKNSLMPLSHLVIKLLRNSGETRGKDELGKLVFFFFCFPFSCFTLPRKVSLVNLEMAIAGQKGEL